MTRQQLLADAVLESRAMIQRYFKGFDDTNHTRTAENLPNHFAWTLGHLALYLHRTAQRFDRIDQLPDSDFIAGDAKSGSAERFAVESVSFGSKPGAEASSYPTSARCTEISNAAVSRLAGAVRNCDDKVLDAEVTWGKSEVPLWSTAVRMVFHNGTHCGQLADLRRALGFPSIFV